MKSTYILFWMLMATFTSQASEPDFLSELDEGGVQMLCSSAAYRKCLNISERVCVSEATEFHSRCFESVGKNAKSYESDVERATIYSICLAMGQLLTHHADKLSEIKACNVKEGTDMDVIVKDVFLGAKN